MGNNDIAVLYTVLVPSLGMCVRSQSLVCCVRTCTFYRHKKGDIAISFKRQVQSCVYNILYRNSYLYHSSHQSYPIIHEKCGISYRTIHTFCSHRICSTWHFQSKLIFYLIYSSPTDRVRDMLCTLLTTIRWS